MEKILGMMNELMVALLVGILTYSTAWAKKFFAERLRIIRDERAQSVAANALLRADAIVESTVKKLQQTLVAGLKEASSDGKLSEEEIKQIGKQTRSEISALINEDLYNALHQTVGDVRLYLENLVEAKVLDLKKDFITISSDRLDLDEYEYATEAEIV